MVPLLLPRSYGDRRGVALTEFALVLPPLTMLLLGIFGYGQYFLLAHSVQQIANDAARATIAGLSSTERRTLANATVTSEVALLPNVKAGQYSVVVAESGDLVTVTVALDASANPLMKMSFVPMPDSLIKRQGVVRQGGVD
jgi:Flp pilus assembly protein TadG